LDGSKFIDYFGIIFFDFYKLIIEGINIHFMKDHLILNQ